MIEFFIANTYRMNLCLPVLTGRGIRGQRREALKVTEGVVARDP